MSVYSRSLGSAGRPVFGRPAAALMVVALIAMLAVGAPAVFASEIPTSGETAVDVPEAPPTQPVTPPVDPPPVDPPVVDQPPADPPPVEPPAVDPPPVDPPAAPVTTS